MPKYHLQSLLSTATLSHMPKYHLQSLLSTATLSHMPKYPLQSLLSTATLLQAKIVEALLGFEVIQVSCGASHVLAVTNDYEVFSWGRGDNGEWTLPKIDLVTFNFHINYLSQGSQRIKYF